METKDNTYELDLLRYKEGEEYEYDYRVSREFFESKENSEILGADVDVHLTVKKRRDTYVLEFDFIGNLEVACDRCLDAVTIPVDTTYDIVVRHGEEFDDSADDLLVIPERQTSLDVSGMIYDTLLLSLPLRRVHPEGQCNPEMEARLSGENRED